MGWITYGLVKGLEKRVINLEEKVDALVMEMKELRWKLEEHGIK